MKKEAASSQKPPRRRNPLAFLFSTSRDPAPQRNRGQAEAESGRHEEHPPAVLRIEESEWYQNPSASRTVYGRFKGRHVIWAGSRIQGGIYLGSASQEALVVDEKYGTLPKIYSRFVRECGSDLPSGRLTERMLVGKVCAFAFRFLKLDRERAAKLAEKHGTQNDEKMALDFFLQARFGAARHQLLLAAYLLEKLIDEGLLPGRCSVANVTIRKKDYEAVSYTTADGAVYRFAPEEVSLRKKTAKEAD